MSKLIGPDKVAQQSIHEIGWEDDQESNSLKPRFLKDMVNVTKQATINIKIKLKTYGKETVNVYLVILRYIWWYTRWFFIWIEIIIITNQWYISIKGDSNVFSIDRLTSKFEVYKNR